MAKQLKGATVMTLQSFNPADPMDTTLKKVKPYSQEKLTEIQENVNHILFNHH
jgi:hypothetical protein